MMEVSELQALLRRATALLDAQMCQIEQGEDATTSEAWQRTFGKESVVSALSKLVGMHKQLLEQERLSEIEDEEPLHTSMSEADWELLELCVNRWRTRDSDFD